MLPSAAYVGTLTRAVTYARTNKPSESRVTQRSHEPHTACSGGRTRPRNSETEARTYGTPAPIWKRKHAPVWKRARDSCLPSPRVRQISCLPRPPSGGRRTEVPHWTRYWRSSASRARKLGAQATVGRTTSTRSSSCGRQGEMIIHHQTRQPECLRVPCLEGMLAFF